MLRRLSKGHCKQVLQEALAFREEWIVRHCAATKPSACRWVSSLPQAAQAGQRRGEAALLSSVAGWNGTKDRHSAKALHRAPGHWSDRHAVCGHMLTSRRDVWSAIKDDNLPDPMPCRLDHPVRGVHIGMGGYSTSLSARFEYV